MHWKQLITDYFTFSRRDRIAIITIIAAIILVFFIPRLLPPPKLSDLILHDSLLAGSPPVVARDSNARYYQTFRKNQAFKPAPFPFNPNNLDADGWLRLGLRPKTIATILRFREKGGRFRKPEDLQRIYGLFPDEFTRIAPFIRLEEHPLPDTAARAWRTNLPSYAPGRDAVSIDINTADTADFVRLPGIGPTLARRILAFRDKLGGFVSTNQVAEVFGLPDSIFRRIQPMLSLQSHNVRRFDLNTATLEQLKAHPYFRQAAPAIIAYRNQHGAFHEKKDLQKIMQVTIEMYRKMEGYVEE